MVNVLESAQRQRCQLLKPCAPNPGQPPFILLPGMDGTAQLQHGQARQLGDAFDVRCLSIPGDDLSSWDALTDQVLQLIEMEFSSATGQIYLFGESFGGCLALKLALRSPRLFQRLILVNPASSFERATLIRWGSHFTQWLPGILYPYSCLSILPFLAALNRISDAGRRALLSAMQSVSHQSAQWRLSLLHNLNVPDHHLRRISMPTLIVASGCDRLLPSVDEARRLESLIAPAQTYLLPQSGHACLLEESISLRRILQQCDFMP